MEALAAAMIMRCLWDLRHPARAEDALLWLKGAPAWLTFETCCGLLGLNDELIREKILRMAGERRAA